jgi:hypothetical protein
LYTHKKSSGPVNSVNIYAVRATLYVSQRQLIAGLKNADIEMIPQYIKDKTMGKGAEKKFKKTPQFG